MGDERFLSNVFKRFFILLRFLRFLTFLIFSERFFTSMLYWTAEWKLQTCRLKKTDSEAKHEHKRYLRKAQLSLAVLDAAGDPGFGRSA